MRGGRDAAETKARGTSRPQGGVQLVSPVLTCSSDTPPKRKRRLVDGIWPQPWSGSAPALPLSPGLAGATPVPASPWGPLWQPGKSAPAATCARRRVESAVSAPRPPSPRASWFPSISVVCSLFIKFLAGGPVLGVLAKGAVAWWEAGGPACAPCRAELARVLFPGVARLGCPAGG